MITNKSLRIHLSPVFALILLNLVACSSTQETAEPVAEQAQPVVNSPPPEEVIRPEPISSPAQAAEIEPVPTAVPLREGVPSRYTVKKGDTLWDISSHFLKDPWLWPEVWHINPAIRNPHLIYPGDVIALTWVDGKPVLSLEGAEALPPVPETNLRTVKLSPNARESKLNRAVDTIPKSAIGPFLSHPFVLSEEQLDSAPYIASNYGDAIVSGKGQRVYARRLVDSDKLVFNVVRKGRKYIDPDTKQFLGYEAINLGKARLLRLGDPATLVITDSYREILKGDMLLPVETETVDLSFFPRAPTNDIAGRIISVNDGVQKIGQYAVVVINKGSAAGLEPGHILEIHQQGELVRQPYTKDKLQLPEERAGLLMIFKTYEDISYGLVMEAYLNLSIYDYVYSP